MRRFFLFLIVLFLLWMSWPFLERQFVHFREQNDSIDNLVNPVHYIFVNTDVEVALDKIYESFHSLIGKMEHLLDEETEQPPTTDDVEKPTLSPPDDHIFSIYNIEIGTSKEEVEANLGTPERVSFNEYGVEWHTFHENYYNFVKVLYDNEEKVSGLYSNQDIISSTKGIKLGSSKEIVRQQLGSPLTKIQKGFVYYELQGDEDYDIFLLDESYVTIFYDEHENNTVTAIQIISEKVESQKEDIYSVASEQLMEGFEFQLFDLTNATRVNHNLQILTWDEHVRETARKHSVDMAENNFFDHTNMQGESPFDRMEEDHLLFTLAGENLAYGQFSSIFAHEGLMNSEGHRKNILKPEYEFLGVGVAFNAESQPFYTENFYAK